jgi:hypothetical protein
MTQNFISTTNTPDYFICYDIELLLLQLQSEDGVIRQHSREVLGKIGKQVVPSLIELLSHRSEHVRWEACKTLSRIKDPSAGYALAEALVDDDSDVRWVAAEALVALEEHAIEPLLGIIEKHFDSVLLRQSAHHVLSALKRIDVLDEKVEAVFEALSTIMFPMKLAVAASTAMDHLREKRTSSVH